jgi:Fe-S-cluster containining protein
MAITTTEGARWDCGGCTACCRHFDLGPIEDAIIEGLEARGVRQAWAPARDGFATRRPGPDGRPAWYFRRRDDGACLFLQEDGACAIHARWGAAAKPAFCRAFPFTRVDDRPAGLVRLVVRADCGGWAESFDTGTPVTAQIAEQADLALPGGPRTFDPEVVGVLPGVGVPGEQWPLIEGAVRDALADTHEAADLEGLVAAVRPALFRLLRREPPEPRAERAGGALRTAARTLEQALGPAVARPPEDTPDARGQRAFLSEVLALVRDATPRLGAGRPATPRTRAFQRLVLHSHLDERAFVALGGLPSGLGTLLLGHHLALAAAPGDGPVEAAPYGRRLATFVRFTRHAAARRLLGHLGPAVTALFLHARAA